MKPKTPSTPLKRFWRPKMSEVPPPPHRRFIQAITPRPRRSHPMHTHSLTHSHVGPSARAPNCSMPTVGRRKKGEGRRREPLLRLFARSRSLFVKYPNLPGSFFAAGNEEGEERKRIDTAAERHPQATSARVQAGKASRAVREALQRCCLSGGGGSAGDPFCETACCGWGNVGFLRRIEPLVPFVDLRPRRPSVSGFGK